MSLPPPAGGDLPIRPLTRTQLRVLLCVRRFLTYDQIGRELRMSPYTAKAHVRAIAQQLWTNPTQTTYTRVLAYAHSLTVEVIEAQLEAALELRRH